MRPAHVRRTTTPTERTTPMATIMAAPAITVAAATWPSSKRGTMTSFVTQRTAHDEATVARAKIVAPLTAMAKLLGCRPTSARIIRTPRHRMTRGASRGRDVAATETFLPARWHDGLGITRTGVPS